MSQPSPGATSQATTSATASAAAPAPAGPSRVRLPTPPRPQNRAPNPLLFLGIFVLGTASFFFLTEKRQNDPKPTDRKKFSNPLLPPLDMPKVELERRKPVE